MGSGDCYAVLAWSSLLWLTRLSIGWRCLSCTRFVRLLHSFSLVQTFVIDSSKYWLAMPQLHKGSWDCDTVLAWSILSWLTRLNIDWRCLSCTRFVRLLRSPNLVHPCVIDSSKYWLAMPQFHKGSWDTHTVLAWSTLVWLTRLNIGWRCLSCTRFLTETTTQF